MIEITHIGTESIPNIQSIAYATWPDTFGKVLPMEQIRYMLNLIYNEASLRSQMLEKEHRFMIAEQDGRALGFTSYEVNYASEPQLMIHKLYLLPESQGMGLGKKFLHVLRDIARAHQNTRLRLKVYYENDKAIGFYEKCGFNIIGTESTDIGNGYIILDNVMIAALDK